MHKTLLLKESLTFYVINWIGFVILITCAIIMFMHRQNGYFEGNEFFTYAKKNTSCICKIYKVFAVTKNISFHMYR